MSRNCVECRHWYWDPGSAGFSDVTPGSSWRSQCMREVHFKPEVPHEPTGLCCGCGARWYLEGDDVTEVEWRAALRTAKGCPDYEEVE